MNDTRKTFEKEILDFPSRWRTHEVFRDFCEAASYSMANAGAPQDDAWKVRETRYAALEKRYGDDFGRFPRLMATLVQAMENSVDGHGCVDDVLGLTFESLELQNQFAGQYFTPPDVCRLMAELTCHDLAEMMATKPYVRVHEPAIGCGRMVLELVNYMRRKGFDPSRRLWVTGFDVDPLCVAMAHVTLSLAGVPGKLVHGNTLSMEQWGTFTTPMARTNFRALAGLPINLGDVSVCRAMRRALAKAEPKLRRLAQ